MDGTMLSTAPLGLFTCPSQAYHSSNVMMQSRLEELKVMDSLPKAPYVLVLTKQEHKYAMTNKYVILAKDEQGIKQMTAISHANYQQHHVVQQP